VANVAVQAREVAWRGRLSTMGGSRSLAEYPFILSLATWAWNSDPSPAVTPAICLDSLPFLTSPCLTRLVAKGIGIGIILAACINKAPVIRNILRSRSVAGLSAASTYGDVILYSNAALYNMLRGNPFTAYGETFNVLLQSLAVAGLTWRYDPHQGRLVNIALLVAAYCGYLAVVFLVLTPDTQYILLVCNPLVLLSTRGAQIKENAINKQTGAQSMGTFAMSLAGSAVRIATTIKEVGWDFHILRNYALSIVLNGILCAQIYSYRANTEEFLKNLRQKKKE